MMDLSFGQVAVVVAGCFRVAVIKATVAAEALAIYHHVHGLRIVVLGDAFGGVVSISNVRAAGDINTVSGVPTHGNLATRCIGFYATIRQPVRHARFDEVVMLRGLVVDDRNCTRRSRAECVLHGDVNEASRARNGDVFRCLVRGAPELIEISSIRAKESADRAMRRHAGCVGGRVNVTRPSAG